MAPLPLVDLTHCMYIGLMLFLATVLKKMLQMKTIMNTLCYRIRKTGILLWDWNSNSCCWSQDIVETAVNSQCFLCKADKVFVLTHWGDGESLKLDIKKRFCFYLKFFKLSPISKDSCIHLQFNIEHECFYTHNKTWTCRSFQAIF